MRSTWLVSRPVDALAQIEAWPVEHAAAGVVRGEETWSHGEADRKFAWASVTKLFTAMAVLVGAEEGVLDLDEPAGPPGSTVRHLLAHASGLPFDGPRPISKPGKRRIYSNTGIEVLAAFLAEKAEMPFADYLSAAVLEPLGLSGTALEGSPAAGLAGPLTDLLAFGRELMAPTLVAPETLQEATTVAFPGLAWDPARLRALRAARLGARLRDPRCEGAALDRHEQLAPHVRALRRRGELHLGRPGGRRCLRRACRPSVRPVGEGGVAAALRRRSRGATMTGSRVEPPDHRRLLHVRGAVSPLPRRLQLGR